MSAFEIIKGSRVFFGCAGETHRPEKMAKFTHVVNCESTQTSSSQAAWAKNFLFLRSFDDDDFPILDTHFETLRDYIDTALCDPSAAVFIHCRMGINRSAALAIAYAAHISGRPAAELIQETRRRIRRLILLNENFVAQLTARWPAAVPITLSALTPVPESVTVAQSVPPTASPAVPNPPAYTSATPRPYP
jgi:predicted protein tyrosine phosphatase